MSLVVVGGLNICVGGSSYICKSLYSYYGIMFEVHLMCWGCIDSSLPMRVHPNHLVTVLLSSYFIGSNDDLYIHPRAL